jgi:hypothetical protein
MATHLIARCQPRLRPGWHGHGGVARAARAGSRCCRRRGCFHLAQRRRLRGMARVLRRPAHLPRVPLPLLVDVPPPHTQCQLGNSKHMVGTAEEGMADWAGQGMAARRRRR